MGSISGILASKHSQLTRYDHAEEDLDDARSISIGMKLLSISLVLDWQGGAPVWFSLGNWTVIVSGGMNGRITRIPS